MMDELDLLKKDWQKKEDHLPKLSYQDIYKMIWKKSSSIVKWILIISILEFTIPHLLYFIPSTKSGFEFYENIGLKYIFLSLTIIQYAVVIYFIYLFYKRYKEISVLDDAKNLMQKIIKTRKTVKHYIIYSLSMIMFIFLLVVIGVYFSDNLIESYSALVDEPIDLSPTKLKKVVMATIAIFGTLFTLFLGGIYFLLYGRLLKKLKANYKELQKLEV